MNQDEIIQHVERLTPMYLKACADKLNGGPAYVLDGLARSNVPVKPGVYGFYERETDKPLYYGESFNLRQRICSNHCCGDLGQSGAKRALRLLYPKDETESKEDWVARLTSILREQYQVRFLPVSLGRKEVEEYLNRNHLDIADGGDG